MYPDATILPTLVSDQGNSTAVIPRPVFSRNNKHNIVREEVQTVVQGNNERIVEQQVETLVHRPCFISNPVQNIISVPVEQIIEKPVERIIEKPVYVKNVIKKRVEVIKHVE